MWLKVVLICVFGCTQTLTSSFDLGGVLSGNRMAGVPLGRSLGDGELDVEGICSEPGFACVNCTHAITCIPLPVGYLKVALQECSDEQTCNARLGTCSTQHVPECLEASQKYQHTCEQVGIFPDAYDCRKFHLCSPPEGEPLGTTADHRTALCPRHYGYDPLTAQCSVKLTKGQCSERPVRECQKVGQNGALSKSPNHYYVCLSKRGVMYPQIFLCPHGWFFWDGFCRPEPETRRNGKEEFNTASTVATEETTTAEVTTSRMESFFSTEKSSTFAPDAFLADKFDLTNYESTDDMAPYNNYDFHNSFENGNEFW